MSETPAPSRLAAWWASKSDAERMRFVFRTVFVALAAAAALSVLYVVVRRVTAWHSLSYKITVNSRDHFYRSHPTLGFSVRPDTYMFTIKVPDQPEIPPLRFVATVGPDGCRPTAKSAPAGRPEVWVFGCSYIWGWPLPDDENFCWLLQERMPEFHIRNFSLPGYGNVHGLVQFRELIASGAAPKTAVFCYGHYHRIRNVAAPSWLANFESLNEFQWGKLKNCRGYIGTDGRVATETVPFDWDGAGQDFSEDRQLRVTTAIFDEVARICREKGIRPVLGVIRAEMDDEVVRHCRSLGFAVADMNVDYRDPANTCVPWDGHPSAAAHRKYADALLPVLRE